MYGSSFRWVYCVRVLMDELIRGAIMYGSSFRWAYCARVLMDQLIRGAVNMIHWCRFMQWPKSSSEALLSLKEQWSSEHFRGR